MSEVVKFYPAEAAKSPDAVLEQSVGQYSEVIVVGFDADGNVDLRASLGLDERDVIWLFELAKAQMLMGVP